jgi:hypothetical protein
MSLNPIGSLTEVCFPTQQAIVEYYNNHPLVLTQSIPTSPIKHNLPNSIEKIASCFANRRMRSDLIEYKVRRTLAQYKVDTLGVLQNDLNQFFESYRNGLENPPKDLNNNAPSLEQEIDEQKQIALANYKRSIEMELQQQNRSSIEMEPQQEKIAHTRDAALEIKTLLHVKVLKDLLEKATFLPPKNDGEGWTRVVTDVTNK